MLESDGIHTVRNDDREKKFSYAAPREAHSRTLTNPGAEKKIPCLTPLPKRRIIIVLTVVMDSIADLPYCSCKLG